MQNKIQDGYSILYTNAGAEAVMGGSLVVIGELVAIASTDIAPGASGACDVSGVFELAKDSAAIAQGASVYLDASGKVTATVGDTPAGKCWADAPAAAQTANIKINA